MTKKLSKFAEAILETATDMHRIGAMDDETYHKITVRHLGIEQPATAKPISSIEIRPALALLNVIKRKGFEAILQAAGLS